MKRIFLWMVPSLILFLVVWQLAGHYYSQEEKEIRNRLRQKVVETFPEQAEQFSASIGLFPVGEHSKLATAPSELSATVLIHGLDDPGKVWQNLTPALIQEGHEVWIMNYPNDQAIHDSASLFFTELKKLKAAGIGTISIVAHSMGGLITRDVLTNSVFGFAELVQKGTVPEVQSFIMVGTPNHGSQMVRFRLFSEVRDQLDRLMKGQSNPLGFILDGAGEAKIDLLPGSVFLTDLNSRPHPHGVDMLIIAGITTPWGEEDIINWRDRLSKEADGNYTEEINQVSRAMISMSHSLGDGLVTVESTRLPGIEHLTVKGTHLTMIRTISPQSAQVPAAVPIITKRLRGNT